MFSFRHSSQPIVLGVTDRTVDLWLHPLMTVLHHHTNESIPVVENSFLVPQRPATPLNALRWGPGSNAKLRNAIDRSLGQPMLLIDKKVMPR